MLSVYDANLLTSLTHLYNTINDSYLTLTNMTVWDMNGNNLEAVEDGNGMQAVDYLPDVTNVSLLNFTVGLDNWTITLFFDETVSAETFDYIRIHVFSDEAGSINLTLTNGSFDFLFSHQVTLLLTDSDICRIKVTNDLWTTHNNTWLYMEQGAVYDWTMRNPLNEVNEKSSFDPIENNPPNLVSYTVNVTDCILVLNFDQPVRPLHLMYSYFLFQNSAENFTESHRLTGGWYLSPNGKQVIIMLTSRDLNTIKSLTNLFTSANTSFLSLDEGAITDMVGNPSSPVEGFQVTLYLNDTGSPSLVEYSIDMNSGQLFLTFSETVDVSSFNLSSFTLQSGSDVSYDDPMQFHTFSDDTFAYTSDQVNMLDNRIVLVNISLYDLNEVKRKGIATSNSTTWLVIAHGALTDNNLQPVVPLLNGINAQRVVNYTDDTTDPELLYYDVSLNTGELVLYFSETVDARTLDVSQITLQSSSNFSTARERFSLITTGFFPPEELSIDGPDEFSGSGLILEPSGDISGDDMSYQSSGSGSGSGSGVSMSSFQPLSTFTAPILTLYLSHYDSNTIKVLTQLATANSSTFLSLSALAVRDTVGNPVSEVEQDRAMPVWEYEKDETRPELRRFDLDIDSGNLMLTFTETVNVSSLDVTQLTLINDRSSGSPSFSSFSLSSLPPYPNTSASFSNDWPVIVVQIGHEDLDAIKNIRNLATNERDTLLIITNTTIWDNAGNPVVARTHQQSPSVNGFTADTTRPELASFDLDMDDGRLILTFTETVQIIDSLDVTQITLQNMLSIENDSLSQYSLTDSPPFPSTSMDNDSRVVTIRLGFTDLNAIKYRSSLATNVNSTFLSLTNLTVVDLRGNMVEGVETDSAQQARIVTPDSSNPVLLSFFLNMNTTTLTLIFNETVNASSLDVSIQHSSQSSSSYHSSPLYLTPGDNETHTSSDNGHVLVVHLGPTDHNELKRRNNLAISNDTTFLVAAPAALIDMSGNHMRAISDGQALPADLYIPDESAPVIVSFSVDMDVGNFVMTFDETVNASTFVLQGLTLQDNTTSIDLNFTLTGGVRSTSDSTELTVYFRGVDLNTIKRLTLCREEALCYLRHDYGIVYDMMGNPVEERADGEALQVDKLTPDTIHPEVISFDNNLTSETITLTFSETVNASSLNFMAFTLQDFFERVYFYTLTDGELLTEEDSTVIEFMFSLEDLNEIKRNTDIFTDRTNSWLTFTEYAIHDMALRPNRVRSVLNTPRLEEGLVPLDFFPDITPPELWDFDLNLTSHELTLYFSETVRARTLNINAITLQNREMREEGGEYVTLTMGDLPLFTQSFTDDYHILVLNLGQRDTDVVKAFTDLATHHNNTYIAITSDVVEDMNEIAAVEIPPSAGKRVRELYEDFVRPELVEFRLDLDSGELWLTFSETINASSLMVEEIALQSQRDGMGTIWRLTAEQLDGSVMVMSGSGGDESGFSSTFTSGMSASGSGSLSYASSMSANLDTNTTMVPDPFQPYHSLTQSVDGPVIAIALGFTDRNAIKWLQDLGMSINNSFLSLSSAAFRDMNSNTLIEVPSENATQATDVAMDTTPPNLVYYDLDLTSEILSLTFDETVNASSLQPSAITLQSAEYTPMVSLVSWYQLMGGEGSTEDSHVIEIQLNTADLNEIKLLTQLATSPDNTYIIFPSSLIRDMSGNAVMSIINGQGQKVTVFTEDRIPPQLYQFALDMDQALLHLTFTETVNASSFNVKEITLQDGRTNLMNRSLTLSAPSRDLLGLDDTVISVQLGTSDLNYIKSTEMFGLSTTDTWLTLTEATVNDMNSNPVLPVVDGNATQATNFTPDITRPYLVAYQFDFILETISLSFNEPMNVSLINYTAITLQDGPNADDQYTLTGGAAQSYAESTEIVITFSDPDIDHFKMHPSLATSANDTFLTFESHAFFDTATVPNPVHPLVDGVNASGVDSFTYYETPEFLSILPTSGRATGGTLITVSGANFGPLANETGARRVDVFINGRLATNTTVVVANTTLEAHTPAVFPPNLTSQPLPLTITIDNSALTLTIEEAFTYLPPPAIIRVFPAAATIFGSTPVTITGNNFGPSTLSQRGPEVTVTIGNGTCSNVTVLNNTHLTCLTPSLVPGRHNVTVMVDEVSATSSDILRALEPPTITDISPSSSYRHTPTQVNITGENFGPTSESADAEPLLVLLASQFNITECSDPIVLIEDTLLTCTMQPNLGPGNVTVRVDSVASISSGDEFIHFDDAGNFSFEFVVFNVSEREEFGNVTVIRHDFPPFASPAEVTLWAFSGTAKDGLHFNSVNITQDMPYLTNKVYFQIQITAGSYMPERLRRGADDDISVGLLITMVTPVYGNATIAGNSSILTIKAICQVVSHLCIADWNTDQLIYYRLDELP